MAGRGATGAGVVGPAELEPERTAARERQLWKTAVAPAVADSAAAKQLTTRTSQDYTSREPAPLTSYLGNETTANTFVKNGVAPGCDERAAVVCWREQPGAQGLAVGFRAPAVITNFASCMVPRTRSLPSMHRATGVSNQIRGG